MPKGKKNFTDWKLKTDESGVPVFDGDGKPVYVDADGKDVPLDPLGMYAKIFELNAENKKHREAKEEVEEQLDALTSHFKGIKDISKWKKQADDAIQKVQNFKEEDYVKAGKVEELKAEIESGFKSKLDAALADFNEQVAEREKTIASKDGHIRRLMVSNAFASSPWFAGRDRKTTLPPQVAETYFGNNFEIEEDKKTGALTLVPYYEGKSKVVTSRKNPGEIADFDEAIEYIIESSSLKDDIIKSSGGGSGSRGGSDTDSRSEIQKLEEQHAQLLADKKPSEALVVKNKIHDLMKTQ